MTSKPLPTLIALLLTALAAALALHLATQHQPAAPAGGAPPGQGSQALRLGGFSSASYDGARLLSRFSADELKIAPRRFSVFNIRSVNELVLSNVHIEVHRDRRQADGPQGLLPAGETLAPLIGDRAAGRGLGRITRGVFNGLTIELFSGGAPHLGVQAKKAHLNLKNRQLEMRAALLEHLPRRKKILSERIIWDEAQQAFLIPGPYRAETPAGSARGEGIKVDLDFRVTRLPPASR